MKTPTHCGKMHPARCLDLQRLPREAPQGDALLGRALRLLQALGALLGQIL